MILGQLLNKIKVTVGNYLPTKEVLEMIFPTPNPYKLAGA